MRQWIWTCVVGLIYLFLVAPILIIIPASFSSTESITLFSGALSLRWYHHFFETPELVASLFLSLRLAAFTTVVACVLGTMAATAIARYRFPGREWLRAFLMAPMIIPGIVLGIALLMFFSRTLLAGTFAALLLAHIIIVMPYVVRTVTATFAGLDQMLPQAAMSLGATPLVAFRTVTLPLLKSGIIAGGIFAFITSFDEFVVSVFLTGPQLTPLSVQIFTYLEFTSDPTIAAISVILIALTTVVVLATERIAGFGQFA